MKKVCFPVLLLVFISSISLHAGPTVIKDNRVTDTATTPVLGRGYSLGTNTYQSTCLKEVVITEPSYDMEYTFESVEDSGSTTSKKTDENKSNTTVSARASVKFGRHSGSAGMDWALASGSKTTTINNETYYNHKVLVTIDIYTYYASVDESRSILSDSAKELLVNKDLPGFFNSCGSYYVRSIGRKASFVSIFNYSTKDSKKDSAFESNLKQAIQAFGAYSYSGIAKVNVSAKVTNDKESKRMEEFSQEASSKRLSIVTHAYGLGKDENASLVAYDLDSFKAAIKDAFISMQNPLTGKVANIEVVPWVENTEFQTVLKLEEIDAPVEGSTTGQTEKKPLYEKKHLLNQNAEFLIEVERADRNLMNMYYKAKLCKANIMSAYGKDETTLNDELGGVKIMNNRTGAQDKTVKQLFDGLTDSYIEGILAKESAFMYGSGGSTGGSTGGTSGGSAGGANLCLKELMKTGFVTKSYREIDACKSVLSQAGNVELQLVSDYCMPVEAPAASE